MRLQNFCSTLRQRQGEGENISARWNLWLTQARIAELFGVDRSVVTKHLKNVFESGELDEDSVCVNFAHTADDGKTYQTKFYNLDASEV